MGEWRCCHYACTIGEQSIGTTVGTCDADTTIGTLYASIPTSGACACATVVVTGCQCASHAATPIAACLTLVCAFATLIGTHVVPVITYRAFCCT